MTDIDSLYGSLNHAKTLALAANFTPAQLAAFEALWTAVDILADAVKQRR